MSKAKKPQETKTYKVVITYTATYGTEVNATSKATALFAAGQEFYENGIVNELTAYGAIINVTKAATVKEWPTSQKLKKDFLRNEKS